MNSQKKMIKNLILFLFLGLTTIVKAQFSGRVESVLNIGTIDYAYLSVEDQGYYKTAAYQAGLLRIGESVEIQLGNIPNTNYRSFIKTSNNSIGVFAVRIETETFSMPINSQFGMPVLEHDILWFSSQQHFDEFYDILTDFSDSPYEFSEDLLKVLERQYPGFSSFNQSLREKFDFEVGLSDDQLESYTHDDYFKDEVLKTLINKYGELGIGTQVYTMFMHSDNQQCVTFVSDKRNIQMLKDFRGTEKDEDIKLKYPLLEGEVYVDGKKPIYVTKDLYSVNVNGSMWADILYTSKINLETVSCTTTKVKLKFTLTRSTLNDAHEFIDQNLFTGTITINWGDGTTTTEAVPPIPVTLNPSGTSTLHQTELFLTHEYASEGTYSVSSSGVFTSEFVDNPTQFTMSDNEEWSSPDIACTKESYSDKVTPDPQFGNDHKAICEGWIKNFGVAHTIGAKITNYKKVNGNWKKRQENISAEIEGVFRDDECEYKESKQEYDSGHEKDIQAVKAKWWTRWYVSNNDCFGTFTVEHEGSSYTYVLLFNPCN